MALLMSPLTDCARYWMSATTLFSSIQFLCSLYQSFAWLDKELSPLCTAPLARHLNTSLWGAGRDPDWALIDDNLWQGPIPTAAWEIRGCLCDWNSTEGSMALCRLLVLGLALGGACLVCVVWTRSPPIKISAGRGRSVSLRQPWMINLCKKSFLTPGVTCPCQAKGCCVEQATPGVASWPASSRFEGN